MLQRTITAAILVPLALGSVILGGWWLYAFFGGAMVLAAYEYYKLVRSGGHAPLWIPALVLIAAIFLNAHRDLPYLVPLLVLTVAIPPLWELMRRDHAGFLLDWGLMVLGVLYVGVLGMHLFSLANLQNGTILLITALVATWMTDVFAYVAGRVFGKRPFFPSISPKKTVEGAIGGIIIGSATWVVLMWYFGYTSAAALLGGIGLALICTAGDLVESLIKRNLGAKDSGTLLAGHGGVLDRLDSMFFTLTFAFYYCTLILGIK